MCSDVTSVPLLLGRKRWDSHYHLSYYTQGWQQETSRGVSGISGHGKADEQTNRRAVSPETTTLPLRFKLRSWNRNRALHLWFWHGATWQWAKNQTRGGKALTPVTRWAVTAIRHRSCSGTLPKAEVNRAQISLIINAARPLPEEGNEVCDQSNWHRALERPLREQLYHKLYPGARLRQLHPRQHRGFPQPQPAVRAGSLRDGAVREPPGEGGRRLGLLAPDPALGGGREGKEGPERGRRWRRGRGAGPGSGSAGPRRLTWARGRPAWPSALYGRGRRATAAPARASPAPPRPGACPREAPPSPPRPLRNEPPQVQTCRLFLLNSPISSVQKKKKTNAHYYVQNFSNISKLHSMDM